MGNDEANCLFDLFRQWTREMPEIQLQEFFELSEEKAKYTSHMGMRNALGLWGFSKIAQELMDNDVWHGDDMGCVVTLSFHRHLHDLPYDIKGQVEFYKDFWDRSEGCSYLQVKQDRLQYLKRDGYDVSRWEEKE